MLLLPPFLFKYAETGRLTEVPIIKFVREELSFKNCAMAVAGISLAFVMVSDPATAEMLNKYVKTFLSALGLA